MSAARLSSSCSAATAWRVLKTMASTLVFSSFWCSGQVGLDWSPGLLVRPEEPDGQDALVGCAESPVLEHLEDVGTGQDARVGPRARPGRLACRPQTRRVPADPLAGHVVGARLAQREVKCAGQ